MGGNRFWEFYLVRYLLGTIFGVIILFYLVINYNDQITKVVFFNSAAKESHINDEDTIRGSLSNLLFNTTYDIKKDDANVILKALHISDKFEINNDSDKTIVLRQTGFPILAAFVIVISGFLYMYFSSMLILVLHGFRKVFFETNEKDNQLKEKSKDDDHLKRKIIMHLRNKIHFWLVGCTFFSILVSYLFDINTFFWNHVFSIMILLSVVAVFFAKATDISEFYHELSKYRAKSEKSKSYKIKETKKVSNGISMESSQKTSDESSTCNNQMRVNQEFIESYRHLREHGNAFGIIVCEILFAFWLITWNFSIWAIFYWSLIGFTAWVLGSYLEMKVEK